MRIVKVARRPVAYWTELYATQPEAVNLPYNDQFEWFCSDFFGPVDTWQTYLRKAGHDASDLICGVDPLDAAWLSEHGGDERGLALLLRQVRALDPEFLVLEAIQSFSLAEMRALREALPRLKALVGVTGYDLRNRPELSAVDAVLTCMPNQAEFVRTAGGKAVLFPWWFDPRVLERLPKKRAVKYNLSFIGSLDPGPHIHDDRLAILRGLSSAVDVSIFANVEKRIWPLVKRYATTSAAYQIAMMCVRIGIQPAHIRISPIRKAAVWTQAPRFPYDRKVYSRLLPSYFGIRMFNLLRQSRATFNYHGTLAGPYAANMRMFEATGTGSCLLTDWKENLINYFAEDEVVSYRSVEEAIEKARWLSEFPNEADQIGLRGQRRTLAEHGFDKRVHLVEEAIGMVVP